MEKHLKKIEGYISQIFTELFLSITDSPYVILFLINILLLFVGTFLNASSAVIILAPFLFMFICFMDWFCFGLLVSQ